MATKESVSWIGVLMSLITLLVKFIRELGGDGDAEIRWLTTPAGEQEIKKFAAAITAAKKAGRYTYKYRVDSRSIDDIIRLGCYDVYDDIVEAGFTLEGGEPREVSAILVEFRSAITVLAVLAELPNYFPDYRAANVDEFLAFGAQCPEVQGLFVCADGCGINRHNKTACLAIRSDGQQRSLEAADSSTQWLPGTKFLLIKKK